MKLPRRGFLKLMPGAALGGKAVAEEAAARLAAIDLAGGAQGAAAAAYRGGETLGFGARVRANSDGLSRTQLIERLLHTPALRGELESLLYEEQRQVGAIDPDLAVLRSFSLSAKITFQRQRNVARRIRDDLLSDSPYGRIGRLLERVTRGFFGGAA